MCFFIFSDFPFFLAGCGPGRSAVNMVVVPGVEGLC